MPSIAAIFPGQGSHAPDMDQPYRGQPAFERGLELLGFDPFERLDEGTRFQQPAIFLCSVAAWDQMPVMHAASGLRIMQVLVEEGAIVKKGQLLAKLDDATLQAQLAAARARAASASAALDKMRSPTRRQDMLSAEAGVAQAEANYSAALDSYHRFQQLKTEGGVSDAELVGKATDAGLTFDGKDYAHGLHTPYWWIKCAVGVTNDRHPLVRAYHRLLVWDIMSRPRATRVAERLLNPLVGKSMVLYFHKPGGPDAS